MTAPSSSTPGQLLDNTASTPFTNAGTFDVPANTSGSSLNVLTLHQLPHRRPQRRGDAHRRQHREHRHHQRRHHRRRTRRPDQPGRRSTITNESDGLLAFGIDGLPTSTTNYGRITNGTLSLGGSADPVFDDGFTPRRARNTSSTSGPPALQRHLRHGAARRDGRLLAHSARSASPVVRPPPRPRPASRARSRRVGLRPGRAVHRHRDPVGLQPDGLGHLLRRRHLPRQRAGHHQRRRHHGLADVSNLRVGSESITATYNGDVVFDASTSRSSPRSSTRTRRTSPSPPRPRTLCPGSRSPTRCRSRPPPLAPARRRATCR